MFPEACTDVVNLAARIGLPIVTVPAGFYDDTVEDVIGKSGGRIDRGGNIPFGICFVGRKWEEEVLIGIAAVFERLTAVRADGGFRPWKVAKTELGDVM